ncbi:Uncharacterised protein [[Clostridium] sordellii]|uniref:Uncharacterized protein n=1 Tax=Paraclostridium sordellii TaxID=1505 RepID=A0A9P1KZR2_PARSO|nr:Uncharacterised protein [[Clostridium] sordellii] [Paeniclostridium sordellii]CEO33427.1 Uncharacterised protein [[Clostridium] sordellii] [Paeniclostridium sordellii]CEP83528.1 Uncharacterised protein [[Clostridium] sordellii] [Paeniclostridium sordellii]
MPNESETIPILCMKDKNFKFLQHVAKIIIASKTLQKSPKSLKKLILAPTFIKIL